MSNKQGNCISEASAILLVVSAIIPEWHENPCDFLLILHQYGSYSYSLCWAKNVCNNYMGK